MSRALNELTPHPVYGALVAYVALDCLVSKSEVRWPFPLPVYPTSKPPQPPPEPRYPTPPPPSPVARCLVI